MQSVSFRGRLVLMQSDSNHFMTRGLLPAFRLQLFGPLPFRTRLYGMILLGMFLVWTFLPFTTWAGEHTAPTAAASATVAAPVASLPASASYPTPTPTPTSSATVTPPGFIPEVVADETVEFAGDAIILPMKLTPDGLYRARVMSELPSFEYTIDLLDASLKPLVPALLGRSEGAWVYFGGGRKAGRFLRVTPSTNRSVEVSVTVESLFAASTDDIALDLRQPYASRFNVIHLVEGETRKIAVNVRAGQPVGLWFLEPDEEFKFKLSLWSFDETASPVELGGVRPVQVARAILVPEFDGDAWIVLRGEQGSGPLTFLYFELPPATTTETLTPGPAWERVVLAPEQEKTWQIGGALDTPLRFEMLAGSASGRIRFGVRGAEDGKRLLGGVVGTADAFVSKTIPVDEKSAIRLELMGQQDISVVYFRIRPERADDLRMDELQAEIEAREKAAREEKASEAAD